MNVKIGTAPCSWGVWYADGTPSKTPYPVFLDQAAEAGYKALEMGPDGYLPSDIRLLQEELSRRGLGICAGTGCYAFATMRGFAEIRPKIKSLCERLSAFEAKYLVTMDESPIGYDREIKKNFSESNWKKFYGILKELGEFTHKEYGIHTIFHQHSWTMIESEAETVRVMEDAELDLCFDTGHFSLMNGQWDGEDTSVIHFMKKYADRIPYLHFKNVNSHVFRQIVEQRLPVEQAKTLDVMCDLADGTINYRSFLKALKEINFNGVGIIEQDVPNATTDEAFEIAKRNLNYLLEIGLIQ